MCNHPPQIQFNEQTLNVFVESFHEGHSVNDLGGKNVRTFCEPLQDVDQNSLPDRKISRVRLRELIDNNGDLPTLTACAVILAWGGMHGGNRNRLFKNRDNWLGVA